MPGGVARTSTFALNNATLPFTVQLADKGYARAMKENPHLKAGLNVHRGQLTYAAVGEAQGKPSITADEALAFLIDANLEKRRNFDWQAQQEVRARQLDATAVNRVISLFVPPQNWNQVVAGDFGSTP